MRCKGRTWRARQRKIIHNKPSQLGQNPEYIALFKWAKKNGVLFHQMRPCCFPGTGRGLMATNQIKAGDTLISVPRNLLVTDSMIRCKYFSGHVPKMDIGTTDLLCLFLIIEKSLAEKSFWFPYITMLPKYFDTPSYFSEKELEIVPSFLSEHYRAQLSDIKKCLMSLKQLVNNVSSEMRGNVDLTFENVRWAWNVVNTRCVYMDCEANGNRKETMACALAPLLDLLNHSSDVEVQAGFSQEAQCYNICTKTKFQKGNQIFINYGPHGNRRLLIEYGFILPRNCQNSIKIDPSHVYSIVSKNYSNSLSSKKHNILRKYCLEETYSCTTSGLSWSLEAALKVLALDDSKLENRSLNIEDLVLTSKEESYVLLFSRAILMSLLEDYNFHFTRMRPKFDKKHQNGSLGRVKLVVELLRQEKEMVENALTLLE